MAYIKINKNNFFNNLDYFSNLIKSKDKISIALKDNAYGHGIDEIASLSSEYGIKHVFVKNLREAKIVEKYNFESIQILYEIPTILTNFVISINSMEDFNKIPKNSRIELKLDTGMHRNGIQSHEIENALNIVKMKNLILKGIFSHFCCADENNNITEQQEELFLKLSKIIKKMYNKKFNIHIANTAGCHKVDNSAYDKVRIGIGAYGYLKMKNIKHNLKPVLSLYANRLSTRVLDKDEHIGYGSKSYLSPSNNFKVSNYDIGYGDGFLRLDNNQKYILPNDREVLGRVSMDSFSLEGDCETVCIFEDASNLATIHKTIEYEILSQLSPFLKRVII